MSEQPGSSRPLKLSSAIITAEDSPSRDLEPDRLVHLEPSISACVLGEMEVMLATTEKAADSAEIPAAERLELHINPILLSSLPDVLHLTGRSPGAHHDEPAARSFTLTLTFSDGSASAMVWSTTFEVPRSPLVDSLWHLTVPFSHSLTPVATTDVE
ncbi:hypothetical protein [Kibdelosporangium aridum]|uniref:hypothetical protein n=1 Tax=Kibdelosporangium aridum TaxID=2030 RepID=UPI000526ACB6